MNVETRSQANIRKRPRQPNFDLNNSIPHAQPKQRKIENVKQKMDKAREGTSGSQFVDLSRTINAGSSTLQENQQNRPSSVVEEEITPDVREMVSDEAMQVQKTLEEKVKKMIKDEMAEVRKTITELTNSMVSLARITQGRNGGQSTAENGIENPIRSSTEQAVITRNAIDNTSDYSMPMTGETRNQNILRGCITGAANYNMEQARIRIDKLGVVFDASAHSMSVDDFIFRLEHLQAQYQIPWPEILRDFHLLMSGAAREWYWLLVKTQGVMDWPSLRHALTGQFQSTRSNFEILRDLVERRQHVNESIDSYFHTMNQIRSKLVQPIPEFDMIRIIKKNVKESLGRIVYPIAVSSVEQLRIECHEAERNFLKKEIRNQVPTARQPTRYVNEIYEEPIDEEDHQQTCLEEITRADTQQQKKAIVCWNCRQPGHIFIDCPATERNLFCYKCGKQNVITPKCPICQSGNQHRGLSTKGTHVLRPTLPPHECR